jgi:predicted nucleic acid-binding protein
LEPVILVDSNVLIDLIEKTPQWFEWSAEQLFLAQQRDALGINAIVFAEIARTFAGFDAQMAFLKNTNISFLPISPAAAHAADAAHRRYRAAGGARTATLPDFFIGAHAQAEGMALMTRDARRIQTYFPDVALISPR